MMLGGVALLLQELLYRRHLVLLQLPILLLVLSVLPILRQPALLLLLLLLLVLLLLVDHQEAWSVSYSTSCRQSPLPTSCSDSTAHRLCRQWQLGWTAE